ncbi:MAG: DUF202 domain-containing protein [Bacteroidales bacterium]|nr:DUF202 domain-containing protein [Bacteroidales bacterium]
MDKTENELIIRDKLAIERTKLANERTFLAYFRTSVVFFGSGIGVLNIHFFNEIDYIGFFLVVIAPFLLTIGLYRALKVRKSIKKFCST